MSQTQGASRSGLRIPMIPATSFGVGCVAMVTEVMTPKVDPPPCVSLALGHAEKAVDVDLHPA
ncbi:hypothetical protein RRF57_008053 [Xylaria bambusicola]|uniref:Uncharacterized protein n=1 Tax=Xylaria bambusicola TaxID=326684 RepID=A0AAN7UH51_9PEZI